MALQVVGIIFDELSSDPVSPVEGQTWFNTTEHRLKIYRNGSTETLIDKDELDAHTGDTSNPHSVTLEQARTAGATLSGDINMGSNKITSLANPADDGDAANKGWTNDQIKQRLQGLDWQKSVIDKDLTAPPGSPSTGDRYIVASPATGAWAGHEDDIAEWNGASWDFTTPNEGYTCRVEDENKNYQYSGSSWELWETTQDHGNLVGLGDDDHSIYHTDGRADTWLTGKDTDDLSEGSGNLYYTEGRVSANTDVAANTTHRGLTSGNPHSVTKGDVGLGNVENLKVYLNATSAPTANDDNTQGYAVGSRWVDVNADKEYVCVDASTASAVWKETTGTAGGGYLAQKAGRVLAASFSGTPKKATVTFSAAFSDANYAVTVTPLTTNNRGYAPFVESQAAGSFTINLGSNITSDLTQVNWIAMKDGESS
jgi:hypothetical protein